MNLEYVRKNYKTLWLQALKEGKKFSIFAFRPRVFVGRRKEYWKEYYIKHSEKIKAYGRQSYEKNRKKNRKYYKIASKKHYLKICKLFPWLKHLTYARSRCSKGTSRARWWKYYGGRGIKCLLTKEQTKMLWERDQAKNLKHPSLDRINPDRHYELDNCRFIEMEKNRKFRRKNGSVFI